LHFLYSYPLLFYFFNDRINFFLVHIQKILSSTDKTNKPMNTLGIHHDRFSNFPIDQLIRRSYIELVNWCAQPCGSHGYFVNWIGYHYSLEIKMNAVLKREQHKRHIPHNIMAVFRNYCQYGKFYSARYVYYIFSVLAVNWQQFRNTAYVVLKKS